MATKLKLTRDQLASFLKDAEQIKQFERLFETVDAISPDFANDVTIASGTAQATANDALAQIQRLADIVNSLDIEPAQEHDNFVVADYIDTNTLSPTPNGKPGRAYWDDGFGSLVVGLKGGNVTYIDGQQEYALCYNDSGVTLTKGQVVYISGAQGNRIAVKLAQGNNDANSAHTIGFVAESIAVGDEGWIHSAGPIYKLNTLGTIAGSTVYLSPTTPGAWTTTKPVAPDHTVIVGFIERVSATVGSIYVKVDNGYELDELHNVKITSVQPDDMLQYDSAGPYWKNVSPSSISIGTATNLAGGATGSVPYQSAASTTTFLNIGTAAQVLQVNAGATSPEWVSSTGTGNVVRAISPTLTTPQLGTPTSGTLTNCTSLPIVGGTTGTLTAARGGTGQTTYSVGDLLYADTTSSLAKLADVATGNALISGGVGVAPAWGKIGLTTHVSGTLPVANGGTGITSLGAGVSTWLGTPSSANLLAAMTDETGTGSLVFGTSPTLITPTLGVASGTSLSLSSNLTFSSTGQRITGDFSTATIANRPLFQTTVANSATTIGVIPSGTAINATISLESAESATNCSAAQLGVVGGTDVRITSLARGTGTVLPIAFWIGGSERMRITSAGNVGIGTTAPDAQLTVNTIASFGDGATATPSIAHKGDLDTGMWFPAANTLAFSTQGFETMRIIPSGHMGVNTIPSPWVSTVRAIQIGTGASVSCWDGSSGSVTLGANLYDSGGATIRYINSAAAGAFGISGGAFTWDTAAAGVAGDAITFTRSMTLTAAGNLGIGTNAPTADAPLHIRSVAGGVKRVLLQNLATTAGTQSRYDLATGTANAYSIMSLAENGTGNVTFELANGPGVNTGMFFSSGTTSAPIVFRQSTTERMRIDNAGNVGIGTATPSNLLSVQGNANFTGNVALGDATTDTVTVSGYMAVGSTPVASQGLRVIPTALTGTTQFGSVLSLSATSAATVGVEAARVQAATAAAVFVTGYAAGLWVRDAILGAGSTITNNYGVYVDDKAVGTNNYGLVSAVSSGTNKWNIYASGTANNYFAGNVGIGTATNLSTLTVNGSFASKSPSTVNAATYTVAATDGSMRFTTTNCTVTLPAPASFPGRILYLNTITANSVTSAASNVIPLGSNTAGTAILAATLGKFAMIQSDGTNWITMMAN